MDPGFWPPGACVKRVFIVYLLLRSTCHSGTDSSCSCSSIPLVTRTKPPGKNCSIISYRYRYTCIDGYVRKAGTSNLIQCTGNPIRKWSNSTLKCIEDPLNPPLKTTTSSRTSLKTTTLPQSSIHTPSTTPASSSVPLTSRSTSTVSSSMTTRSPRLDITISPSSTSPSSKTPSSTSPSNKTPSSTSPSSISPSSPSLNSTFSTVQDKFVATNVIAPVALLLIVLAAGGAGCWLYKRKTRNKTERNHTNGKISEECVPMHQNNVGT